MEVYSMKNKSQHLLGKESKTLPCVKLPDDPYHILLNEKQAAAYLGLTDRAMQQRRYQSLPPAYIKLPNSSAIRYRFSVLIEFVADGEVPMP